MTNRIRLRAIILIFAGMTVLLLAGSSCYTIIRHPRIAQADHQRPEHCRSVWLSPPGQHLPFSNWLE
jgi:hypothetical protein